MLDVSNILVTAASREAVTERFMGLPGFQFDQGNRSFSFRERPYLKGIGGEKWRMMSSVLFLSLLVYRDTCTYTRIYSQTDI